MVAQHFLTNLTPKGLVNRLNTSPTDKEPIPRFTKKEDKGMTPVKDYRPQKRGVWIGDTVLGNVHQRERFFDP